MGYPTSRYQTVDSSTVQYDTGRSFSATLWQEEREKYEDHEAGDLYFEDFKEERTNTTDASAVKNWFLQDATAGGTNENFTNLTHPDGVATLSATTGTDHFGIEVHHGELATSFGYVILPQGTTNPRGKVVFETRCDVDASDNYFIGLTEPIVEFLSSTGTLPTASDYIGFYRADGGDLTFVYHEGTSGAATSHTILTDAEITALTGNVKFGFSVDADGEVVICVNGQPILADTSGARISITTTELPNEALTQKFASTRGATSDLATVTILIDWVATWVARA